MIPSALNTKVTDTRSQSTDTVLHKRTETSIGSFAWRLLPEFQLRSCGFPARLVLDFDPTPLRQAARCEDDARQEVDRQSNKMIEVIDGRVAQLDNPDARRDRSHLQKARKRILAGRPLLDQDVPIVAALGLNTANAARMKAQNDLDRASKALEIHVQAGLEREIDRLVQSARQGRFEEALFLSNPAFHERVFRQDGPLDRRAARDMRHLLTVSRYLRRFATRNETVSFFGPTTFARLDPAQSETVMLGSAQPIRTEVDCSTWIAKALLDRARNAIPALERTARQDPMWRYTGDAGQPGQLVRDLDGRRITLDDGSARLWANLITPTKLAQCNKLFGGDKARFKAAILAVAPALRWGPELCSTELYTLETLAQTLDDPHIDALQDLALKLANEPWPQIRGTYRKAEALVEEIGLATTRRGGDHYADRTLFNMESTSAQSSALSIGEPAIVQLQTALSDVLPLCALDGLLRRADARQVLRKRLAGRDRPLLEVLRDDPDGQSVRSEALTQAVADLVQKTPLQGNIARLNAKDLAPVLKHFRDTLSDEDLAPDLCIPGIDVLAAGTNLENATWVLGEIHDDSSAVFGGSQARLGQPRGALYDRFAAQLGQVANTFGMATVLSRRRHKAVTPEMPGLTIEFTGTSAKSADWCAPIAEVTVAACGTHLLYAGNAYHLWPGDVSGTLHIAIALPAVKGMRVTSDAHMPRIMIGDMVFQRAQWRVLLAWDCGVADGWRWAHHLRKSLSVPRWVYVRHPVEPKPIFVDLENPMHLADLDKLPKGEVDIVEALPAPDQLWWDPDGVARSCEMRIGTFMRFGEVPV